MKIYKSVDNANFKIQLTGLHIDAHFLTSPDALC